MSKMTREEFDNVLYAPVEDPAPKLAKTRQHKFRTFWFLWVPGGALAAFVVTLLTGAAGVFLPVWGVATLLLWGVGSTFAEEKR